MTKGIAKSLCFGRANQLPSLGPKDGYDSDDDNDDDDGGGGCGDGGDVTSLRD